MRNSKTADQKHSPRSGHNAQHEPLFIILEQHLAHSQDPDLDRKTLVEIVLSDYLDFLRGHNITIPKSLEKITLDELAKQVTAMLLKKIYGRSILEYRKSITPEHRRRVRARYSKLPRSAG